METNSQVTVGTCIRELRKNKGMSINDLVRLSEISKGYISQIENNKFIPSPDILEKIAKALDVPHLYLLEKAGHTKESDRIEILEMILHDLYDEKKYKEEYFQHTADQYGPNLNEEDKEDFEKIVKEYTLEIQKLDEEFENILNLIESTKNNKIPDNRGIFKIDGIVDPEDTSIEETKSIPKYKETDKAKNMIENFGKVNEKLELENLFKSEHEITINGKTLTVEEKQKALQILKLTFDK